MSGPNAQSKTVQRLLQDDEVKVILDSPAGDYCIEYYTTTIKDSASGASRQIRTYRLRDLIRGGTTQEPWDKFDSRRQTKLVNNLIRFGGYRVSKVVSGWTVTCPSCGHVMRGGICEPVPTTCGGAAGSRCRHRIADEDVAEELRVPE